MVHRNPFSRQKKVALKEPPRSFVVGVWRFLPISPSAGARVPPGALGLGVPTEPAPLQGPPPQRAEVTGGLQTTALALLGAAAGKPGVQRRRTAAASYLRSAAGGGAEDGEDEEAGASERREGGQIYERQSFEKTTR